ncbi:M20 metallopeptidase family protein [Planococcus salinarum]|uniref:M20 metallopeptidase family protein n=1 Tax=Planococcus salinarum TaxID=622695 RepID=UPI000E3EDFBA|nr:amidohydrolase [Planococcus salinarum]TAA72990.1 amidohydrolase [Planococcus salinarum]
MESKNFESAKQLRHELHQHPELSNEEEWTKQHLINFLKSNTKLEIVDKGNWFYAAYRAKKGGRNVAFRADYDALPMDEVIDVPYGSRFPGKAHKCGHDGHAATLAGFALEIDQKGADRNIFFLFQPAEETADGAIQCADLIKEENIDEIFGYHNMSGQPFKSVAVIDGTAQFASKGMTISMKGTPAHASDPDEGVNPSFPIANIINAIPEFTNAMKKQGPVVCTVIGASVGSKAFGISAGEGELLLTIRALHEKNLDELQKNIENLVEDQAKRYGLSVSFSYTDEFPVTFNHKESSDKVRQVAAAKGMELVEMEEVLRTSEDYGHYTELTKGAYFYIGNGEDYPQTHTNEYDFRDELIETGVELFMGLAEL